MSNPLPLIKLDRNDQGRLSDNCNHGYTKNEGGQWWCCLCGAVMTDLELLVERQRLKQAEKEGKAQ